MRGLDAIADILIDAGDGLTSPAVCDQDSEAFFAVMVRKKDPARAVGNSDVGAYFFDGASQPMVILTGLLGSPPSSLSGTFPQPTLDNELSPGFIALQRL